MAPSPTAQPLLALDTVPWQDIAKYLTVADLARCLRVCGPLLRLLDQDVLWQPVFENSYPSAQLASCLRRLHALASGASEHGRCLWRHCSITTAQDPPWVGNAWIPYVGMEGLASYHFTAIDEVHIDYSLAPSLRWTLDNGSHP
eukprot:gene1092-2647_t